MEKVMFSPALRKATRDNFWTEEEDRYLIRNYRTETYARIGDALGRSLAGVYHRRKYLKLPPPERTPEQWGVCPWSPEHTGFLLDNFGKLSYSQIGKVVGRTEVAVFSKAKKIGLFKRKPGKCPKTSTDV